MTLIMEKLLSIMNIRIARMENFLADFEVDAFQIKRLKKCLSSRIPERPDTLTPVFLGGGRFFQIYFLILFRRPPYFVQIDSKVEDTFWRKNQIHTTRRKKLQVFWKNLSPQNDPISDFSALKYESLSVSSHIFQLSQNEEQKIITIRRTVLIQTALDDPDYGEAFKYHEHT